jgi:preprotein translocase subunit Sss1
MTPSELQSRAKAYVDRVLESQRQLGHASNPTEDEYQAAIRRAAASLAPLIARRAHR